MRDYDPTDEYDVEEAERIKALPWQLDLLAANPGYCCWGPHEDYMWVTGNGWNSAMILPDWGTFARAWGLDDLNECVNFYFSVRRESKECPLCGGNGYHPEAQKIVRTFYAHSCLPDERPWNDRITEDEAAALVAAGRGRLDKLVTADDFNAAERRGGLGGHDAINRSILIRARLERLGLPDTCPDCGGHGNVFIEPDAHVSLTLWWLHPRKGCSRGVEITRIMQDELPKVRNFLEYAAQRNADRFAGLSRLPQE